MLIKKKFALTRNKDYTNFKLLSFAQITFSSASVQHMRF